ncbi:MAG TPA: hypothetical protein PKC19_20825 [Roseiflexaceae bacterium]|nr:hypothetical protein [Roseiflexaceae bacterium]
MSPLNRRRALARLMALPTALLPAAAMAQERATLTSPQSIAAPLQPIPIEVRIPGYSGPAAIILFDARKRYAGTAEGRVANGSGVIPVVPRGALGPQWAALFASGQQVATNPSLFTLDAQTSLITGQERFDRFVPAARTLMSQALLEYPLNGSRAHGYRSPDSALIWLRDHVYTLRGVRYFDPDVRGTYDIFQRYQQADGSFPDFLPRPEVGVNNAYRTAVEADVEYLYVQGVYEAWQATGDDAWLAQHRDSMRKALTYSLRDPLRWDTERGLIKRPFTIDTWDFEYGPTTIDPTNGNPAPRHWIDEQTKLGIFHGDNTGMAQALRMMAQVEERIGDGGLAQFWRGAADSIMSNLNGLSWNGRFYRHHVKLQPYDVPGVDEELQLSLSNAIALNRGVLSPEQGQAILAEYIARGETTTAFAEWFSIDPPFPYGSYGLAGRSGELPGSYVNGGIMPLVGGELARGAFRHGRETYGFAILEHYWLRMLSRGRTFLWYHPSGAEGVGSEDTIPTDAWSTAHMLAALIEGAAGIRDNHVALRSVTIAPAWGATSDVRSAYAVARYAGGDGYAAYHWQQRQQAIDIQLSSSADPCQIRLLLPADAERAARRRGRLRVLLNGNPTPYTIESILLNQVLVVAASGTVVDLQVRW